MSTEQIKKAVDWWAREIRKGGIQDNGGSESREGFMAMILATNLRNDTSKKITDEQIDIFKDALTKRLEKDNIVRIDTDYHPCYILSKAAEEAGIDKLCFPWKTTMILNPDGTVTVYGYAGKNKETF